MTNPKTCHDTPCYDEQPCASSNKPVRRLRVCFNPTTTIHPPSPFLLPATKDERRQLWYLKRDVRAFAMQDRELIEEYTTIVGQGGDEKGLSADLQVRGLEFKLTEQTRNEVRSRQELVRGLVMEEQAKQRLQGVVDTSQLRTVSLTVSRPAQYLARNLGMHDATEAIGEYSTGKLYNEHNKPETVESFDENSMLGNETEANDYLMKSLQANGATVGSATSPKSTMVNIDHDARLIIFGCVLPRAIWI